MSKGSQAMEFENLVKNQTGINESARKFLDITRDDYGLCTYVQYRSADPRQKIRGWCCDKKEDVAEWVGISRPGLYKMIDRLEGKGLLETDARGNLCITAYWIDVENECKQSLQRQKQIVNKVDKDCKQSLQKNGENVNLVTHNKVDIKLEEKEYMSGKPDDTEILPIEEKKEKEKKDVPPPLDFSKFDNPEAAKAIFARWLKYRTDIKKPYKSEDTLRSSVKLLLQYSNGISKIAEQVIENSIGNGYQGFFEPKPIRINVAPAQSQPANELTGIIFRK